MNKFPTEIIDHIIYFTKNRLYVLRKVNNYFRQNALTIRLGNIINNDNFDKLSELTVLKIESDKLFTCGYVNHNILQSIENNIIITDNIISELINLRFLGLSNNKLITDKGIYGLINLKFIDLSYNKLITDKGLSNLTNLTKLNLSGNNNITDKGIYPLTKLVKLNISDNKVITSNGISGLANLTAIDIARSQIPNTKIFKLGFKNLSEIISCKTKYDSEEDEYDNYKEYDKY